MGGGVVGQSPPPFCSSHSVLLTLATAFSGTKNHFVDFCQKFWNFALGPQIHSILSFEHCHDPQHVGLGCVRSHKKCANDTQCVNDSTRNRQQDEEPPFLNFAIVVATFGPDHQMMRKKSNGGTLETLRVPTWALKLIFNF